MIEPSKHVLKLSERKCGPVVGGRWIATQHGAGHDQVIWTVGGYVFERGTEKCQVPVVLERETGNLKQSRIGLASKDFGVRKECPDGPYLIPS